MTTRFIPPREAVYDSSGNSSSGAKLNFYEPGTTTPQDTYSDEALTSANANPVVADSAGRFGDIFMQAVNYKVVLTDSDDVVIHSTDPVHGGASSDLVIPTGGSSSRTLAALFADLLSIKDFGVKGNGSTDDTAAINTAIAANVPLWWPAGSYKVTGQLDLDVTDAMWFGAGRDRTIISLEASDAEVFLGAQQAQIRDLTIDGTYVADYCLRTDPAVDAQRGGHLIFNVECIKAEKANIQINQRSDGTTLAFVRSNHAGNRDGNGLPTTDNAHSCEFLTEGHISHCVFASSTGWNLKVGAQDVTVTGGRLNFGWRGNLLARQGTLHTNGPRKSTVMVQGTFIENPGVSESGASSTNSKCHAVKADGESVVVRLSGCQKLTVRKSKYGLLAVNGAQIHYDGPMPTNATYAAASAGTFLFGTASVVRVIETGGISSGSPALTLSEPGEWETDDRIRIAGAGAASADLDTKIVSGGGTTTLTLADNAGTQVTDALIDLLTPREAVTVSETGGIDSASKTLTLSAAGDWHDQDPITVVGAGAASADLETYVVSGGGTTTLTLADAAGTTAPGAVVKHTAPPLGRITYEHADLASKASNDSAWSGLARAQPGVNGLTIAPQNYRRIARLLDGTTRDQNFVPAAITSNRVTSFSEGTEKLTGADSLKMTGDGSSTQSNNVAFTIAASAFTGLLGKQWIMITAVAKREQVGSTMVAQSSIRLTGSGLRIAHINLCENEVTELGSGNKGDWLTYQAIAWIEEDDVDITVNLMLDSSNTASDDIVYFDHVDLHVIDPTRPFLPFVSHDIMSGKVVFEDDFLGDVLKDELLAGVGSGTNNEVALSAGSSGRVNIKTSSVDAAISANGSSLGLGALDWRANNGGLKMEARLRVDDITSVLIFVGFTDVLGSTVEAPIFKTSAADTIDSDATNACGVCFDTDGTTDEWFQGGVKADTDTAATHSGTAPVNNTYQTIRVEVSAAGAVEGFIDGVSIGTAVASAVAAATALVPIIFVANRSASVRNVLVDYLRVEANR